MGEPVTQGQFFQAIQDLREEMAGQHTRQRLSIEEGFRRVEAKLDEHTQKRQGLSDRILVIETQRLAEKEVAARRGALAGALAAVGFGGLVEVVKAWMHR